MTAAGVRAGVVPLDVRGRRAWTAVGLVLALVAVGIWTGRIITRQFLDSYATLPVQVRSFPGPVRTVDLSVREGTVLVERAPASATSVRTFGTRTVRTPTDREVLRSGTLHITSSCGARTSAANMCRRDYVVRVPGSTAVVADVGTGDLQIYGVAGLVRGTVATGSASVTSTSGRVQVTADTGQINVADARGPVTLHDVNGSIGIAGASTRVTMSSDTGSLFATELSGAVVTATSGNGPVTLTFRAPPQHVTAASQTGDVTVVLPAGGPSYQLDLSSRTGTVTSGVTSDPTSTRTVHATSDNGNVTVRTGLPGSAAVVPYRPAFPSRPKP